MHPPPPHPLFLIFFNYQLKPIFYTMGEENKLLPAGNSTRQTSAFVALYMGDFS